MQKISLLPKRYLLFFRFLVLGGLATVVNLVARFFLSKLFPYEIAIIIAYIIGMVVAFTLFRLCVFSENKAERSQQQEVVKFVTVNLWGLGQTLVLSVFFVDYFFPWLNIMLFREELAHFFALSVLTVTSYLGHKHFTFK